MPRLSMTYHSTDAYRAAVERHLADLPDHVRAGLADGIRADLARAVAALAPGEPLDRRLGGAESYAARLRATVELQPTGPAARLRRRLGGAAERLRRPAR
jgi:hypothetical protein